MTLKLITGGPVVVDAFFHANAAGFNRRKAIRFAQGVLSPGAYLNNRVLPSHPDSWSAVLEPLFHQAERLKGDFDAVASVATGGVPHGVIVARRLRMPHFIVKKDQKGYGIRGLIDGDPKLLPGRRVLVVEDMSSTFKSVLRAMEVLKQERATVSHTLLLSTWDLPDFKHNVEGHSVFAVCDGSMLVDYTVSKNRIDRDYERILRHWLKHPEDEIWSKDGSWELPKSASE